MELYIVIAISEEANQQIAFWDNDIDVDYITSYRKKAYQYAVNRWIRLYEEKVLGDSLENEAADQEYDPEREIETLQDLSVAFKNVIDSKEDPEDKLESLHQLYEEFDKEGGNESGIFPTYRIVVRKYDIEKKDMKKIIIINNKKTKSKKLSK
jgi:hypothetical protein